MTNIGRKITAFGVLGAWLCFGTNAQAAETTSVEFIVQDPARAGDLLSDGFSVTNMSTTQPLLVTAPLGAKVLGVKQTFTVSVYIDNANDGLKTTCSVFGHSVSSQTEHSGTASTTGHGARTLDVSVTTTFTGSSGDETYFVIQCSLPKGGTHKIFGAFAGLDMKR